MNTLKAVRTELHRQLSLTPATVYDFIPERPTPPCAVIESGSPYMVQGETFCEFRVNMNVLLLVATAANQVQTEALDQLICDVMDEIDFDIDAVDQPGQFTVNNADFYGTRIAVSTFQDLKK
jgi:hypothetical protein